MVAARDGRSGQTGKHCCTTAIPCCHGALRRRLALLLFSMAANVAPKDFHPQVGREVALRSSNVNFIERLLIREEIDSLELDLARAREMDDDRAVCEIGARIGRLEANLAIARRGDVRLVDDEPGRPFRHAA